MTGDTIGSRKKSAAHNSLTNGQAQNVVGRYGGQRANIRQNSNVAVTDPAQNIFLSAAGSHFGSMTSSAGCVEDTNINTLEMPS